MGKGRKYKVKVGKNMNRDSFAYKIRRKCQVVATKLFGYKLMNQVYYRIIMHRKCNLKNPQTLNEKICWLKLFDYPANSLVIQCSDKYEVRNYVKEKIGETYLVPLLGCWKNAEEIDFEQLPYKFILKCNHGCAYNIIVSDKNKINAEHIKKVLNKWLREDFSLFNVEPQYHAIKRKIICEKHLGDDLVDYKFFCMNGKIRFYYISSGLLDDHTAGMRHYLADDTDAPFQRTYYKNVDFHLSDKLNELKALAEKLAEDFLFVRVDFLLAGDKIYFSELTYTPGGGYNTHEPQEEFDKMGQFLKI